MNFNDEGFVECELCKGKRVIPSQQYPDTLMQVCPKCGGRGGFDWVDYVMGRPEEHLKKLAYDVAYENMHRLISMIKEESMKIGHHATITIEQKPAHEMHRLYPDPFLLENLHLMR